MPGLLKRMDLPFSFFGHCLGGLTLFETARALVHFVGQPPQHLFISGSRPPHMLGELGKFEKTMMSDVMRMPEFRPDLPIYAQPDDVFVEVIRHFSIQATDQMVADPELRRLMLPVIRAEFAMAASYFHIPEQPWEIPITCFLGRDDPYVSRRQALGWGRFTNTQFNVHMRGGMHFAVVDDMAFIHDVISKELSTR
jgi:epothilone polyketide synthase C